MAQLTPRIVYFSDLSDSFFVTSESVTIDSEVTVVGYLEVDKGTRLKVGTTWEDIKTLHSRPEVHYLRFFKGKLADIGISV